MIEAFVMVWLAVIGLTTLSPTWDKLPTPALVSLVIPAGVAVYILSALTMLAGGVTFSTYGALGLASLAAIALTAVVHRSRTRSGRSIHFGAALAPLGYAVIGTLIVTTIAQNVHLTRLTVDSVRSLLTAHGLETTGSLELINRGDLRARHLVVPLLHTSGVISGRGYVASITPLFAVSGFGFAAWLTLHAFASFGTPLRWRRLLLLGGAALVLTTNRILYHAFYVNGHMVFAVYLLIGLGAAWIARRDSMRTMFLPASLAFAALPALRPEAVITGLIFLIAVVAPVEVSARARWGLSAPFIVVTLLWYGVALPPRSFDADLGVFGSVYGNIVLVAGFAVALALSHHRRARWLLPAAPWLMLAGIVGYVGVNALRDSDLLRTSLSATAVNVAIEGLWGVFWWIVPVFVLGAILVTNMPLQRMWILPGITYGVALLAFVYLRDGAYRIGQGDSGNGMLMHVALVLIVYVVIAAGHAVAPIGTRDTATAHRGGPI